MSQQEINVSEQQVGPNTLLYEVSHPHGFVDMTYNRINRMACIANLVVDEDYRQRGIGKLLLSRSLELAAELDARSMYAAIISREAVRTFVSVFGEDAVTIKKLGSFTLRGDQPRHDTIANLWFEISG